MSPYLRADLVLSTKSNTPAIYITQVEIKDNNKYMKCMKRWINAIQKAQGKKVKETEADLKGSTEKESSLLADVKNWSDLAKSNFLTFFISI